MPLDPPRNQTFDAPDAAAVTVTEALHNLNRVVGTLEQRLPIPFGDFLKELVTRPAVVMRNIFQVFHDMVKSYVGEGVDEYPDDPESIHYAYYDCRPCRKN